MENRRTHAAAVCALTAVLAVAGCTSAAHNASQPSPAAATRPQVMIAQVTHRGTSRFAFCTAGTCPKASPKTAIDMGIDKPGAPASKGSQGTTARPAAPVSIDMPFAFNATAIRGADRLRLKAALTAAAPRSVRITGRSDGLGAPPIRQRIATARATAVRAVVHDAVPGADVTIEQEISTNKADPADIRRHQRRATVSFTPPLTQP